MKRILILCLTVLLLLCVPCYAVDDTLTEEKNICDIFSGDVDIPSFPEGFEDFPYRFMYANYGADNSDTYYYVCMKSPATMVVLYDWGHFIQLKDDTYRVFKWNVDSDSWVISSYWSSGNYKDTNLSGWSGFTDKYPNDRNATCKLLYSNHTIVNTSDRDIYYFKTLHINALSYQWVISDMIQMLCRVAVVVVPVVLLIISVYFAIHQIKKIILMFVGKGGVHGV